MTRDPYELAGQFAGRIELELRRLNAWQTEPLPPDALRSRETFCFDTMSFYQWLQFAMVPRLNRLAAGESYFPKQSDIAVYAAGELGNVPGAAHLREILAEYDSFINDLSSYAPDWYRIEAAGKGEVEPESEEKPKDAGVREHVELYWQTRVLDREASTAFESEWPLPGATWDVGTAERVFDTVTRFVRCLGELEWIEDEYPVVNALVEADRGPWVVRTMLCRDHGQWWVERPRSMELTMRYYLSLQQIHPPYVHDADARGRAMRFWARLGQNRLDWASEVLPPESRGVELQTFSQGYIDELYCYLDHEEEGDLAEVRVLMNTHSDQRTWRTKMFRRDGVWFIDYPATIEASR